MLFRAGGTRFVSQESSGNPRTRGPAISFETLRHLFQCRPQTSERRKWQLYSGARYGTRHVVVLRWDGTTHRWYVPTENRSPVVECPQKSRRDPPAVTQFPCSGHSALCILPRSDTTHNQPRTDGGV